MARPKDLTESDKFFLQNHINNDPAELAKAIKNTEVAVKEYISLVRSGQIKTVNFSDAVIKKERNGQVVATVMSEGASQLGDIPKQAIRLDNPDIIHKCRPKKG